MDNLRVIITENSESEQCVVITDKIDIPVEKFVMQGFELVRDTPCNAPIKLYKFRDANNWKIAFSPS